MFFVIVVGRDRRKYWKTCDIFFSFSPHSSMNEKSRREKKCFVSKNNFHVGCESSHFFILNFFTFSFMKIFFIRFQRASQKQQANFPEDYINFLSKKKDNFNVSRNIIHN